MTSTGKLLTESFYQREDVVSIAIELLGKHLVVHDGDGSSMSGRIVEVEAYNGVTDRASHAFGGRRTSRTETMYLPGGHCYIYLCYGIHHLFNVVTGEADVPHAILIRGIELSDPVMGRGPGKLSKSMGITTDLNALALDGQTIGIYEEEREYRGGTDIYATPRIGIDYAGEDAALPYRFFIPGKAVSGNSKLNKSAVRVN